MEDCMEDIIKQIIQIDSIALSTKQNNEELLRLRKEQYEEEMKIYEEQTIKEANKKAEELYNQVIAGGMLQCQLDEERCKQATLLIENHYLQVENLMLDKLFNELFLAEE
ncbi:hypothetical protein [Cellulosilyticum sp. I15G10I2]|uniref:hypothetical protein n=1 Tax=Cellulosilyticum sp. I15G10I2 TaxID=1892843 RepID=UPI00085C2738|nr:hypothetical protein [Cellulosilyticum sp. I15G10I2]